MRLFALLLLALPLMGQPTDAALFSGIYQDSRNDNDLSCDSPPANFTGNCGILVDDNTDDVTTWWSQVSTSANPNGTGEAAIVDVSITDGDVLLVDNLQCAESDGDPLPYISNAYLFAMACLFVDEDNWECVNIGTREDNSSIAMEVKRTISGTSSQTGTAIMVDEIDVRMTVQSGGEVSWDYSVDNGENWVDADTLLGNGHIDCTSGCSLYMGAYAYATAGLPFVGGFDGISKNGSPLGVSSSTGVQISGGVTLSGGVTIQ